MRTKTKTLVSLITVLAVTVVMCFGGMEAFAGEAEDAVTDNMAATEQVANPDETDPDATIEEADIQAMGGTADMTTAETTEPIMQLTVRYDGKSYTFSKDELFQLPLYDNYKYSSFNANPSYYEFYPVGYAVEDIINTAFEKMEVDKTVADLDGESIIRFISGTDGADFIFLKGQLFDTERYYFKNASGANAKNGAAPAATWNIKEKNVPIISRDDVKKGRLFFGQVAPNEQNFSNFADGMYDRHTNDYTTFEATISIEEPTHEQWEEITSMSNATNDGWVNYGTGIKFSIGNIPVGAGVKYWVYYTTNGSEPKEGSAIYNYDKYGGIKPPVINKIGPNTIKVRAIGYGKKASDVTTFTVYGLPYAPKSISAASTGYRSVKVSWSKVSGATGYEVYRYNGKSYVKIATLGSSAASYVNNGLATGTSCSFKVRSYYKTGTTTKYSPFTAVRTAKPVPAGPAIRSISPGKKKAVVRWTRVAGATGYKVYRSTNAKSGFKCVKTIKKAKTVSFTNKKLKKGKIYYYRIQSIGKVKKKSISGGYSAVKGVKITK